LLHELPRGAKIRDVDSISHLGPINRGREAGVPTARTEGIMGDKTFFDGVENTQRLKERLSSYSTERLVTYKRGDGIYGTTFIHIHTGARRHGSRRRDRNITARTRGSWTASSDSAEFKRRLLRLFLNNINDPNGKGS